MKVEPGGDIIVSILMDRRVCLFIIALFGFSLFACQPGAGIPTDIPVDIDIQESDISGNARGAEGGVLEAPTASEDLDDTGSPVGSPSPVSLLPDDTPDTVVSDPSEDKEPVELSTTDRYGDVIDVQTGQSDTSDDRYGDVIDFQTGQDDTTEAINKNPKVILVLGWWGEYCDSIQWVNEDHFFTLLNDNMIDPAIVKLARILDFTGSTHTEIKDSLKKPGYYLLFHQSEDNTFPEKFDTSAELKSFIIDPQLTFLEFIHIE